ncbi:P27 family phage terminase small subunit [Bacillota bacterium Meth-B3]
MAKDGTNRGGRRVRAGDKPLPLIDKIAAGKAARILEPANLRPEELLEPAELTGAAELAGEDMPAPGEYLSARQKDGRPLGADALYTETWNWLRARGCEKLINPRLVEAYAQAFARFIQCEEAISTYGLLGKHPTTGGAITSPFVQMSQSFQKQANLLWYEIFDVVKQNCTTAFVGNPQDDMMEALLSGRKGR